MVTNPESPWFLRHLSPLFAPLLHEEHLAEGGELVRRKKVLDFTISPGSITAKVQDELPRPHRVSMQWPQLPDPLWEGATREMAKEALFLASLLAGVIPAEVEEVVSAQGSSLFPRSVFELKFQCDCEGKGTSCRHRSALYLRLLERLVEEPFLLVLLSGHGRDETISSIQQHRIRERSSGTTPPPLAPLPPSTIYASLENELSPEVLHRYWTAPESALSLSYKIRADDLPAALLKRLEPIPLGSLEGDGEQYLEEAYEHLTRRAQAYGLGLSRAQRGEP